MRLIEFYRVFNEQLSPKKQSEPGLLSRNGKKGKKERKEWRPLSAVSLRRHAASVEKK